jgi:hypothetical protein
MIFISSNKTARMWLAAAVMAAGATIVAGPAEARMGFGGGMRMGGFGGGMRMGGFGGMRMGGFGGMRMGGFHHARMGGFHHMGGFHRPFVHRAVFAHRPFVHHRRHFGGAFATGFVGGAALGLASSAYAYPYDYGYSTASYNDDCYVVRRRVVNPWGYVVVRPQLVCY